MLIPYASEAEWHALREADITASTLAGHFGHSSWSSEYSDYCRKMKFTTEGMKDNALLRAGRMLEAGIIAVGAAEHSWDVLRPAEFAVDAMFRNVSRQTVNTGEDPIGFYLRDPDCRLGATPDAVILNHARFGECPVEAKNVSWQAYRDEWEGGEAPVKYWLQGQVQTGLGRLTGLKWDGFVVLALVAGNDLKALEYPFDPEAFAMIQGHARAFWERIAAGQEPDLDPWRKADQEAVKARYRRALPPCLDLSEHPDAERLAASLARYRAVKTRAEKRVDALTTELLHTLGEHEAGRLADGTLITANVTNRAGYTMTVEPTSYRVVRFKTPKPPKEPKEPRPRKSRKVAPAPLPPPEPTPETISPESENAE